MSTTALNDSAGYWYAIDEKRKSAVRVLNAMRDYRSAEVRMRRRSRDAMGMGENDMVALRYLLAAQAAGRTVSPTDLSKALSISSASTTLLVDRLVKGGHAERSPHPTDRRGVIITSTASSDSEVHHTLGSMHRRMLAVAESMTAVESSVVIAFLESMHDAVELEEATEQVVEKSAL
jgi:DNA-binding MarR family transcriptional regulator